jgi:hypothetical protein
MQGEGYCHCGCGEQTPIAHKTDNRVGWTKGQPRLYVPYHHRRGPATDWSNPVEPMKQCTGCAQTKPLVEFFSNGPEAVKARCKTCHAAESRRWREANRERARELQRQNDAAARARGSIAPRDPEKNKARMKLFHAVARGEVRKADRCERCGALDTPGYAGQSLLHGHHHDYGKPLDVEWLCISCHTRVHMAAHDANQDRC